MTDDEGGLPYAGPFRPSMVYESIRERATECPLLAARKPCIDLNSTALTRAGVPLNYAGIGFSECILHRWPRHQPFRCSDHMLIRETKKGFDR